MIKLEREDPVGVPTAAEGRVVFFRDHDGKVYGKDSDGTVRRPTDSEVLALRESGVDLDLGPTEP